MTNTVWTGGIPASAAVVGRRKSRPAAGSFITLKTNKASRTVKRVSGRLKNRRCKPVSRKDQLHESQTSGYSRSKNRDSYDSSLRTLPRGASELRRVHRRFPLPRQRSLAKIFPDVENRHSLSRRRGTGRRGIADFTRRGIAAARGRGDLRSAREPGIAAAGGPGVRIDFARQTAGSFARRSERADDRQGARRQMRRAPQGRRS